MTGHCTDMREIVHFQIMRLSRVVLALLALIAVCVAQTVLTNDAILKIAKAGLGEDILVSTVRA